MPGVAAASDVAVTVAAPIRPLPRSSRSWRRACRSWAAGPGRSTSGSARTTGVRSSMCRDEGAVTEALVELLGDPELSNAYGERNERVVRERLGDPEEALETLYLRLLATSA